MSENLMAHVIGVTRPVTAYTRKWLGIGVKVIGYHGDADLATDTKALMEFVRPVYAAEARLVERDAAKRGGKKAARSLSWLFTGGPETNDLHRDESTIPEDAPATLKEGRPWTLDDGYRFAERCGALIRAAAPGAKFVLALHVDEKRVHAHAEMPAMVEYAGGTYRLGNAPVREGLARLAAGFKAENKRARATAIAKEKRAAARHKANQEAGKTVKRRRRFVDKGPDAMYLDDKSQMRLAHDVYGEWMAEFGIERGKSDTGFSVALDREKGMQAKLDAMERDLREAEEAKRAAELDAAKRAEEARVSAWRLLRREGIVLGRERELAGVAERAYGSGEAAGVAAGRSAERRDIIDMLRSWSQRQSSAGRRHFVAWLCDRIEAVRDGGPEQIGADPGKAAQRQHSSRGNPEL